MINSQYTIKQIHEHYEVFDLHNKVVCSGDTRKEAEDTFVELFTQHLLTENYIN